MKKNERKQGREKKKEGKKVLKIAKGSKARKLAKKQEGEKVWS